MRALWDWSPSISCPACAHRVVFIQRSRATLVSMKNVFSHMKYHSGEKESLTLIIFNCCLRIRRHQTGSSLYVLAYIIDNPPPKRNGCIYWTSLNKLLTELFENGPLAGRTEMWSQQDCAHFTVDVGCSISNSVDWSWWPHLLATKVSWHEGPWFVLFEIIKEFLLRKANPVQYHR